MKGMKSSSNKHLPTTNAETDKVNEAWDGTNEQWWNWYLSLADNSQPQPQQSLALEGKEEKEEDAVVHMPSLAELKEELAQPYQLTKEHIQQFQADSYIRLKDFFSAGALQLLKQEALRIFYLHNDPDANRQFSSMELMWLESEVIKTFVTSKKIGHLAANLLQVSSVRLFHDDFLCKEPNGGRTPWHFDAHHYPIVSRNVGTVWFPLQSVSQKMGMLELAKGMDTHNIVKETPFDKFSQHHDRTISEKLNEQHIEINRETFELGEISFHHCLNVHGASANHTTKQRLAFGASYFENGARVLDSPTITSGDWQKFMPGVQAGERLASRYNPIVWDGTE